MELFLEVLIEHEHQTLRPQNIASVSVRQSLGPTVLHNIVCWETILDARSLSEIVQ